MVPVTTNKDLKPSVIISFHYILVYLSKTKTWVSMLDLAPTYYFTMLHLQRWSRMAVAKRERSPRTAADVGWSKKVDVASWGGTRAAWANALWDRGSIFMPCFLIFLVGCSWMFICLWCWIMLNRNPGVFNDLQNQMYTTCFLWFTGVYRALTCLNHVQ